MQFIKKYVDDDNEILEEIFQTIFSFLTEEVIVIYHDISYKYMLHSFYTLNIANEIILPKHPMVEFFSSETFLDDDKEWKNLPQISNKMMNLIIKDIYFQIG